MEAVVDLQPLDDLIVGLTAFQIGPANKVFGANENDGSTDSPQENEDFAFIGGDGQLIIHGSGTIQIIDLLAK